jgi:predicted transcriptional regulator
VTGSADADASSNGGIAWDGVARFVERFALALVDGGMSRMPARVFACLLAEPSGRLTAGQLADRLDVSAAAISGAVRQLVQIGMAFREREPGERLDHYAIYPEVFSEMWVTRTALIEQWADILEDGAAQYPAGDPGRARLLEAKAFFRYTIDAIPELVDRWQQEKARYIEAERALHRP